MRKNLIIYIAAVTLFAGLGLPVRPAAQQPRYKLIDLGTFGGPNSFFPGCEPCARALNNQGLATGYADTSAPDPYYPNCFNDCYLEHAFKWENGALVDLGALPSGASSLAASISANGHIAGESQNGLIDPTTGLPEVRTVIWTQDGHIIDLKTFGGDESIEGDINGRGQVVGMAENKIPDPFSFIGANQGRAFLWDGVLRDLGTLGGPDAFATYINDRGQVAGFSYIDSTANASTGIPTVHPFLWENGYMRDLGSLGGLGSPGAEFNEGFSVEVNGMNASGEVVGTSPLAGDETHHAFLWNGKLKDLGTLGGANSQGWWVSDSGLVVGRADFSPESANHHAFFWWNDVMLNNGLHRIVGSGFFVTEQGHVVTAFHVWDEAKEGVAGTTARIEIGIPISDAEEPEIYGPDVEKVGADCEHDLVLLKASIPPDVIKTLKKTLKPVRFADKTLSDGDPIAVSGFPHQSDVLQTSVGRLTSAQPSTRIQINSMLGTGQDFGIPEAYLFDLQLNPGDSVAPDLHGDSGASLYLSEDGTVIGVWRGQKTLNYPDRKVPGPVGFVIPYQYVEKLLKKNRLITPLR